MSYVEKHYYVHELFRGRSKKHNPLFPVSRTTGNRMVKDAVAKGIIPPPFKVSGREIIPESSVAKLTAFIRQGGFADLRVNQPSGAAVIGGDNGAPQ